MGMKAVNCIVLGLSDLLSSSELFQSVDESEPIKCEPSGTS